ncbi:MAG: hypothetical protein JNK04_06740 [Myxococcales bacterium]|nr:hypothetical protein [Myxococcales bacterium]
MASAGITALVAIGATGCESTIDIQGGGGQGECCLAEPECPAGTLEVSQCLSDACQIVEACCSSKLCEPASSCTAEPQCESFEVEVATCEGSTGISCRAVTDCGSTIFCEEPEFCTAVPVCDEGDEEQPSGVCPDDGACYQVELCGSVITCADYGLPHGCPPIPPVVGQTCDVIGLICDYPINGGDCYDSWTCVDSFAAEPADAGIGAGGGSGAPQPSSTWEPLGTVCAGDGGGV